MPSAVLADSESTQQNIPPLLVHDLEATLLELGCRPVQLDDTKIKAATSAGWLAVVPSDATGETLVFCPPEAISSVRSLGNGEVAGSYASFAYAVARDKLLEITGLKAIKDTAVGWVKDSVGWTIQKLLYYVFLFLAMLGNMLSNWFAQYIPKLLVQPEFVEADIVRILWPSVLTIVNMGFMIALVFIALLTTLRLDVAGGVRRLLPRLLIAALLVNFSLVIAGVILDMSRIVMSGTSVLLELPDIDALPEKIIAVSGQLDLFINAQKGLTDNDLNGWDEPLAAGLSAVGTWAMAIALMVVIVGLVVRYIFIIVLLIISPVAYVMLALPGMTSLGKKWWVTFLKYVIYGPVVLFFILAAVFSLGENNEIRNLFDVTSVNLGPASGLQAVKGGVVNVIMFVVFFILAAMAGKHAGIIGSSAVISVVASGGKRARGVLYRGAARTGKGAGRVVGAVPRAAGRRAKRVTGDLALPMVKAVAKRVRRTGLGGFVLGAERDKDGNLLKGETSWSQRRGRAMAAKTGFYPKGQKVWGWEKQMKKAGTTAEDVRNKKGAYANINNKDVGTAMSFKQTGAVINVAMGGSAGALPAGTTREGAGQTHVADLERLKDMTRNKFAYNNIDEDQRVRLASLNEQDVLEGINKARTNAGLKKLDPATDKDEKKDDGKTISRIERIVRDIKQAARAGEDEVTKKEWV